MEDRTKANDEEAKEDPLLEVNNGDDTVEDAPMTRLDWNIKN